MPSFPIAAALRRVLSRGYHVADAKADVMAGLVVGVVALPLSMALAIAVGAPPQHGLYTAIFAGFVAAVFGGCKFQVSGPTAAFVVILAPIVTRYGLSGLLTAGFLAGFILVGLGAARLGNLIRYIPMPVTTGFTTGIAVVIATLQLKDVFGLELSGMPEHYVEKVEAMWSARSTARGGEVVVAATTLALLIGIPRILKRVPAPLVAIILVASGTAIAHRFWPGLEIATIGSRFHTMIGGLMVSGVPSVLPSPALPWGEGLPSFGLIRDLFSAALAIALLGAIESLLSGVIADGMTGTKHDSNSELVGIGLANIVAPIFGGIAATGALARTATNIRAGARSPFAAMTHAIVVLLAVLFLSPLVAYIPMASLAALLLLVAWNMSEVRQFLGLLRVAPKSDVFVLITCFSLTVLFDMVVAVSVGFVAAAILFMRRMAELTETRLQLDSMTETGPVVLPEGTLLYEINGPLFFGAAQTAMGTLAAIRSEGFRTLILNLGRVSVIDATGFVALEAAIARIHGERHAVILAGPLPRPRTIFDKAKLETKYPGLRIAEDLETAVQWASTMGAPSSLPRSTGAPGAPGAPLPASP